MIKQVNKRKVVFKALAYCGALPLLEEGPTPLLDDGPLAFLLMTFLLVAFPLGCLLRFSSVRSSGLISHKEETKSLMMEGEIAGGVAEQPTQFLSLHASDLKPL